jgi:hypothetical protein
MPTLRTPEDRFRDLPGFDYAPNYLDDLPGYSASARTTWTKARARPAKSSSASTASPPGAISTER